VVTRILKDRNSNIWVFAADHLYLFIQERINAKFSLTKSINALLLLIAGASQMTKAKDQTGSPPTNHVS
jgi:hypothetical protein